MGKKIDVTPPEPTYEHEYPLTKNMDDRHVRLEVDHSANELILSFSDILEKPINLLTLRDLQGKITFRDGRSELITFYSDRYFAENQSKKRRPDKYVAHEEWVEVTPAFKLNITIPYNGKNYHFTFDYAAPDGKIIIKRH
jgi:hypothetical protein